MSPKLPPTDTGACGTPKGMRRHYRKDETACPPCRAADVQRKRNDRLKTNGEPRMTGAEIAAEIEFFLRCGEGTHAILTALGYAKNPHGLRQRLSYHKRQDLNQALFGEAA